MKNRIKKTRYKPKSITNQNNFLYNFSSIGIFIEILIGAILGIAICFGFVFSFFVLRGNLFISTGIFLIIMILAVFFVMIFKYMFILITLKIKEIDILDRIAKKH